MAYTLAKNMNIIPLASIFLGTATLIAALSIPLIMRMIPMNQFYGVRFPQSFKSEKAWYEINAFGGKALLISSVPILLVGLYGLPHEPRNYFPIGNAILLVSVMVACLASYIKARAIDKKNGEQD
jgi:uncharacterized membrane protein